MKSYLIGVDLGTMGTKAAIFDTDGQLLASAYEESKLTYPRPGCEEQDPEDFYASSARTVRQCVERSGINSADVVAIAFDGQMAGIGTVDKEWGPPTVYDSWLDTRCKPAIQQMRPFEETIVRHAGGPPDLLPRPQDLVVDARAARGLPQDPSSSSPAATSLDEWQASRGTVPSSTTPTSISLPLAIPWRRPGMRTCVASLVSRWRNCPGSCPPGS